MALSEAMNKQLTIRLMKMLKLTLKNHNRYGYNKVLALLDDTDRDYWPLIGLDKLQKRWKDYHYYIARLFTTTKNGE